jgi:hypothetical protein
VDVRRANGGAAARWLIAVHDLESFHILPLLTIVNKDPTQPKAAGRLVNPFGCRPLAMGACGKEQIGK